MAHDEQITRPFFYNTLKNLDSTPEQRVLLATLFPMFSSSIPVLAGSKSLNRYSILPGKTFSSSAGSKEKYKVLRLVADDVIYENTKTKKILTVPIGKLLREWESQGIKEITFVEDIIQSVKDLLGPVLGTFLTAALVSWLLEKLK